MGFSYANGSAGHTVSEQPDASLFERHCHSGYELLFVLRGEGEYIVEGTHYPLRDNTLMLLRPWEYHYVCPQKSSPYERYVISFNASVPMDAAAHLPMLNPAKAKSRGLYFSSGGLMRKLRSIFRLLDCMEDFADGKQVSAKGETLFRTVVTQALLLLSTEDTAEGEASSNRLVSEVLDYLNRNLAKELSLDRLAQDFFISKYYLCRIFRRHTGMSLMTYLTTKRIALAQQLLDQGVPSAETAAMVGFHDYSAFYRAYRKQTGHSPVWGTGGMP